MNDPLSPISREVDFETIASRPRELAELLFWTDTSFPVEPGDQRVDFYVVTAS